MLKSLDKYFSTNSSVVYPALEPDNFLNTVISQGSIKVAHTRIPSVGFQS